MDDLNRPKGYSTPENIFTSCLVYRGGITQKWGQSGFGKEGSVGGEQLSHASLICFHFIIIITIISCHFCILLCS